MTQRFIIDENVAILAQKMENDQGEADITCRRLVESIIEICHSLVFDTVLWDKIYHQLLDYTRDQPFGARSLLRLIFLAMERDGKIINIGSEAPPFAEETEIPQGSQDDKFIVRLAVASGATLVTTDGPLRDDLAACSIQARYALSVLSPEGALASLTEP